MKHNAITINDIGEMISRLENRIINRFDGLDFRVGSLEGKVEGMQKQLDHIYLNYTTLTEHKLLADRTMRIERSIGIR